MWDQSPSVARISQAQLTYNLAVSAWSLPYVEVAGHLHDTQIAVGADYIVNLLGFLLSCFLLRGNTGRIRLGRGGVSHLSRGGRSRCFAGYRLLD